MAVTMRDVRGFLDPEEPDYDQAAQLGPEALPHLEELVAGDDPMLASKATFLAGLINADRSGDVIERASASDNAAVRVAAAAAIRHLSDPPPAMYEQLLGDQDPGVRKTALKSANAARAAGIRSTVEKLARTDLSPTVRDLASETVDQLPE